jgi:hypothetical protein
VSALLVASGRSINAGGGATSSFATYGEPCRVSGRVPTTHAITTTGVANAIGNDLQRPGTPFAPRCP